MALLLAILVIALMGTATLLLSAALVLRIDAARRAQERVTGRALTDAAIAQTLSEFQSDRFFRGVDERDLGGGTISSRVVVRGAGRATILAASTYGRTRAYVRAEIAYPPAAPTLRVVSWQRLDPPDPDP